MKQHDQDSNNGPVEKGTIILPASAKELAVSTMTAFGKQKPDTGKGTRIKKVTGGQYAIKLDGLPVGAKATFESFRHIGDKEKK